MATRKLSGFYFHKEDESRENEYFQFQIFSIFQSFLPIKTFNQKSELLSSVPSIVPKNV